MHKKRGGFTLIEMLLYGALLSILVLVLTDVFVSVVEVRLESDAYSNVAQTGRFLLARLAYDVQQASAVTLPATLGGSGSTLALTINGVTNTYALSSSGTLQVTNTFGTNDLSGSETTISNLNFLRIGNTGGKDTIQLSFTIQSKTIRFGGTYETETFSTTVSRR